MRLYNTLDIGYRPIAICKSDIEILLQLLIVIAAFTYFSMIVTINLFSISNPSYDKM